MELEETMGEPLGLVYELAEEAADVEVTEGEVCVVVLEEDVELELDVGAAERQEQAELILAPSQSSPLLFGNGMPPRRMLKSQNSVGSGTSAVLINVL